ncbi:GAF domain-containing protein [Halobacillus sp. Marseille-Q1614]|uniref:GAF domain-containing protein n=1 Tax=Halobacillus sp. Marseille-Q1614 TaxID=2709134 RepID=UPI0020C59228|nr:GAF domain-containing protein [Halobacillus sp. Marseille-Q1614]
MANQYNLAISEFRSLKKASKKMFASISKRLNVQTAYVVKRGNNEMTVLSSYNKKEEIIPEGYSVEYGKTYCRLIISSEDSVLNSVNLSKDEIARELEVTAQLQVKGFLGVTLRDMNGEVFGTLCVMDREEKAFKNDDIEYLQSMAEVLSHIIELDQTKYNMAFLNVPIIPIRKGVSILSIQGIIDEFRAEKLLKTVLQYGTDNKISFFIIDLSGLIILDGDFPPSLISIVQSLQLMGIETIMTGITPSIAQYEVNNHALISLKVKTVHDIQTALEYIGFNLVEK